MRSISFSTKLFLWLFSSVFNYAMMLRAERNRSKLTLAEDDLALPVHEVIVVGGVTHWWVCSPDISAPLPYQGAFREAKNDIFRMPALQFYTLAVAMLTKGTYSAVFHEYFSIATFQPFQAGLSVFLSSSLVLSLSFSLFLSVLQSTPCSSSRNPTHHANQSLYAQHTPHNKGSSRPFRASCAYHLSALGQTASAEARALWKHSFFFFLYF